MSRHIHSCLEQAKPLTNRNSRATVVGMSGITLATAGMMMAFFAATLGVRAAGIIDVQPLREVTADVAAAALTAGVPGSDDPPAQAALRTNLGSFTANFMERAAVGEASVGLNSSHSSDLSWVPNRLEFVADGRLYFLGRTGFGSSNYSSSYRAVGGSNLQIDFTLDEPMPFTLDAGVFMFSDVPFSAFFPSVKLQRIGGNAETIASLSPNSNGPPFPVVYSDQRSFNGTLSAGTYKLSVTETIDTSAISGGVSLSHRGDYSAHLIVGVPEPAAAGLILLALPWLATRRARSAGIRTT